MFPSLIFLTCFILATIPGGRGGGGIKQNGNKQSLFIVDKESMICYGWIMFEIE